MDAKGIQDQNCNPFVHEKDQSGEQKVPALLLPFDILSVIFLETCQEDWRAPFTLGGVCRWWRQAVLDTPRAWSLVHLSRIQQFDAIPIILDRGAPHALHLVIGGNVDRQLRDKLTRYPERVHCLRIDYKHFEILQHGFSNVTKIVCTGDPSNEDYSAVFDGTLFPKLRCLYIRRVPAHGWSTILPPIEELSFISHKLPIAIKLIRRLAHQLTLLRVFPTMTAGLPAAREKIVFPRLLHLTIIEVSTSSDSWWPFDAHTPILKSYHEFKRTHPLNMHRDTQTVKELRFDRDIDFWLFPQVREVRASSVGVLKVLSSLEAEPRGWPDLNSLQHKYSVIYSDIVEQRLNDFNRKHARNINSKNWDSTLPSVSLLLSPCDMNRECDINI